MGEQPPLFGLGRLYVCRVEDKDKEPQLLGEPVTIKPGMLTYKDDDNYPPHEPKGFSTTLTGTIEKPSPEIVEMLNRPTLWDVRMEHKPGRMPRKMKKAHRSDYKRNTKWKRKVANYLRRLSITLHDAEIVVSQDHFDSLSALIKATIKTNDK